MRLPQGIANEEDFWGRLGAADSGMPHRKRNLALEAANLGATIRALYAGK